MIRILILVASDDLELYGAWVVLVVLMCPRDGAGVEGRGVRQGRLPFLRIGVEGRRHDNGRAKASFVLVKDACPVASAEMGGRGGEGREAACEART